MKKIPVLFATLVALVSLAASAQAQVIIKDTFQEDTANPDNPQNIAVDGVKPAPVNLPGAAWQMVTGDGSDEAYLTPPATTGAACFHNVAAAGLSLAGNGTGNYVKPTTMTVSADMAFATDAPTGTCFFGFYSKLSGPHTGNPTANFTGLVLQKNGTLQLIENGTASGTGVAFTGKYDPTTPVTVSYTIDTTKGTIANVTLNGSTSAYSFTSKAFTNAATAFLGIGGQTDGGSMSYFTNLQLSAGTGPPTQDPAKASPPPAP